MEFLSRQEVGEICESTKSSCLLQRAHPCDDSHDSVCIEQFTILIFPFLALFIGTIATPLARVLKVSYTLVLLIIGIFLGILGCGVDLGLLTVTLRQWVHLSPPNTFFYVFLAPLIFEASFNTEWHVFKRLLIPILTAAFIIVTLQVGLISIFQLYVIQTPEWSAWAALMFGAMLSATDPISVTATLKSLGASELLNTLIEGESLLNDGSAFVLWEAFFENTIEEDTLSVGEIIGKVFRLSLGGMAMGIAFGIVALIMLGLVYDEYEVEVSLTVIVAFLGFWTAQAPSVLSGVICNVASGLTISAFGRHLITPSVREPLAEFWELLSWIANTIVFVHAGVLMSAFIWSCAGEPNAWYDYLFILVYYLYLQVIRMALILLFVPLMRLGNHWYQWKQAVVVGFSGLRGAVSLILALEVAGSTEISIEIRSRVVLWTTGIVGLSLLLNGFLIKPLVHLLQLDKAKKTREDFLQRARALMVQKTLTILDSLCIETSFKSTRWSYVVKNVLPDEWLEKTTHAEGYRDVVEQVLDNKTAATRKSLEMVRQDAQNKMLHSQITRRMSSEFGTKTVGSTPHLSPRPSRYDYVSDIARYSQTYGRKSLSGQSPGAKTLSPRATQRRVPSRYHEATSPEDRKLDDDRQGSGGFSVQPIAPLSLGPSHSVRSSYEGPYQRSIDADIERYGSTRQPPKPNQAKIRREVAALHRSVAAEDCDDLSDKDREVRRRLLTAILSHVRTISNTSLVEFSVVHNLEEDCQFALDANDEGRDYDLFSFLDNRSRESRGTFYKFFIRILEGKDMRGESAIITAYIVLGIMTEILKEEILYESSIVQWQAEKLYQGAAALLNRLETLNGEAFEWVESQFAVYVCENKQDDVLEDLLESGIVDESEHKTLHEELIEVRRRYVHQRHSIFMRGRKRIPERSTPRQLLLKHPLFASLPRELMQYVDRYGELVHLKSGQALQSEKGSLVLVLDGLIRPLGDTVLPRNVASRIQQSNVEVDVASANNSPAPGQDSRIAENIWASAYMEDPDKREGKGGAEAGNEDKNNNNEDNENKDNEKGKDEVNKNDRAGDDKNGTDEDDSQEKDSPPGFTGIGDGAEMHWCFPTHNAFCGPAVTLSSHHQNDNDCCAIAKERAVDTQFGCCEIAGKATVFTLPVMQVKMLARENEAFRFEITRSLARQIVLESVADQRPYILSQFMDTVAGHLDIHSVIGRATRVLERLPYMSVIALHSGECSSVHMQGPGVLLNGTVRVSIVDTSGLVGAINLLHEQLTGPALLPAGGLFLEEVHETNDPSSVQQRFVDNDGEQSSLHSELAGDVCEAVTEIYDEVDRSDTNDQCRSGKILAHVLVEEIGTTESGVDKTALRRLSRWTVADEIVDMNGRFGMNRHIELAPLTHVKVQKKE